jgi:hypothetical protein
MTKQEEVLRALLLATQSRGKLRITYSGRSGLVDSDGSNQSRARTARNVVLRFLGVGPANQHYWKLTLAKKSKQRKQHGNTRRQLLKSALKC